MSILLKDDILHAYRLGKIHINPMCAEHIGPNSVDVTLASTLKMYDPTKFPLDYAKPNSTTTIVIPKEGLVLEPGTLYLGSTCEEIGSDHFVPMYEGRSSLARLGIQSHLSAGFGDVGFKSNWTLEILVVHPVRIYPNMRIGQVYFHRINPYMNIKSNRYQGKYANQKEPMESRGFQDKEWN